MFLYRKDPHNCGDYWCSPQLYFDKFKNFESYDIFNLDNNFQFKNFLIVGGGGLGKKIFHKKLQILEKIKVNKKIICWGVGFNEFDFLKRNLLITKIELAKKVSFNPFNNFDLQGIRDYGLSFKYDWVPCVSCLHPLFKIIRNKIAKKRIGIFYHHRMRLNIAGIENEDYMSNYGTDLEEKLNFISNYEYIITNSYHGVYWAHLLNKKVLCLPVKSSLLNFPNQPTFIKNDTNNKILDESKNFPNFLEECIEANLKFYQKVMKFIGL